MKRASLWTVDRGSRGLSRHRQDGKNVIMVGSAVVHKQNRIHVLHADDNCDTIDPICIYNTPGEDWSHEVLGVTDDAITVVAGTRYGSQSFASLWSLDGDGHPAGGTERKEDMPSVNSLCKTGVQGGVLKVINGNDGTILVITDSCVNTVSITESSLTPAQSVWVTDTSDDAKIISDGDWVDMNTIIVTSGKHLRIVDKRNGNVEKVISVEEVARQKTSLVPMYPPRLTSACASSKIEANGQDRIIYAGADNGGLYAFDIRGNEQDATNVSRLDEQEHAHRHFVSKVSTTPQGNILTGGTDGVVRCWKQDGRNANCLATFPQHDDTVTNLLSWDKSTFVSISYDGRVALRECDLPQVYP